MTPADFSRRVTALGLTSRALPAARAVLVDGRSRTSQAREHGVDQAQLSRLCARIERARVCGACGQAVEEAQNGE